MSEPILKVKGLKVHFPVSGGFLAKKQIVKAVDGVDFEIAEGETFGLVGESGSGKSPYWSDFCIWATFHCQTRPRCYSCWRNS